MVFILRKQRPEELEEYIEREILTSYHDFDKAHDLSHVKNVIDYALELGSEFEEINQDLVYTAAAYHDLGLSHSREKHHQYSAQIVKEDEQLQKYFSEQEIEIISDACYHHRSSSEEKAKRLTSQIVADADSMDGLTIERMIIRAWNYGLENYEDKSISELYDNMYQHLISKYGKNGYAYQSLYLKETKELFAEEIKRAQRTLAQKNKFKSLFKSLIQKKEIEI